LSGTVAVGAVTALSEAEGAILTYDPTGNLPSVVGGYAVDPSESLIVNGDFSAFTSLGGTEYAYDHWTYYGSPVDGADRLFGPIDGELGTLSGPLGAHILGVSDQPAFDSQGKLSNSVEFNSYLHLGWKQTVSVLSRQQYLLSFDMIGATSRMGIQYVDGLFGVDVGGHDTVLLRAPADGRTTYQLLFEASTTGIDIGFISLGRVDSRLQEVDLVGWTIPEDSITSDGEWDNVTLTPVPEPPFFTLFLIVFLFVHVCLRSFRNRLS